VDIHDCNGGIGHDPLHGHLLLKLSSFIMIAFMIGGKLLKRKEMFGSTHMTEGARRAYHRRHLKRIGGAAAAAEPARKRLPGNG
jgi:hypothetical protein